MIESNDGQPGTPGTARLLPPWLVKILFGLILATGLGLRLLGLSDPPFDSNGHGYRQSQTLSTIEDFDRNGIDLLRPKTIYMGYPGTFVLEMPLFQAAAATLYKAFGPHVALVRILNILAGLSITGLLFLIVRQLLNGSVAVVAASIYWLAPLNITYHRSTLLDPTAVAFGLLSFLAMARLLFANASTGAPPRNSGWLWVGLAGATLITALIKALYLWPAVLLLGYYLLRNQFKPDRRLLAIVGIFAVAGAAFLAWNTHASHVNNESLFTRGINPTGHLGLGKLAQAEYYDTMLLHRPKRALGIAGLITLPLGLLAAWRLRTNLRLLPPFLLLALIAPTYLLAFANINFPHDYYQLIVTPFASVIPAFGIWWLATWLLQTRAVTIGTRKLAAAGATLALVTLGIFGYVVWLKAPVVDPKLLDFQTACRGHFQPISQAMVFVDRSISGGPVNGEIPQFIYAANLWGFGRAAADTATARRYFDELSPTFPDLQYLVFYGIGKPAWLPNDHFKLIWQDDTRDIVAYQKIATR